MGTGESAENNRKGDVTPYLIHIGNNRSYASYQSRESLTEESLYLETGGEFL